jgi:hypothetical protein
LLLPVRGGRLPDDWLTWRGRRAPQQKRDPFGRMDELQQLQEWCISQCNQDWEHTYGVKIDARQARPNPLHPKHGAHHNG